MLNSKFISGLTIGLLFSVVAIGVAAITDTNRARIILDLLKDGAVANETPYGSVDLAVSPIAIKYADAFWSVFNGQIRFDPPNIITTPTNAQKATFFLRRIGIHCKEVLKASRVPIASNSAAATESAVVDAETTSDLGP